MRKPIQFMFGDGFGEHPTVIHRKTLDEPPHGNGFWLYLGFSTRLRSGRQSSAYINAVFDMGRGQVPPWLVIRQMTGGDLWRTT